MSVAWQTDSCSVRTDSIERVHHACNRVSIRGETKITIRDDGGEGGVSLRFPNYDWSSAFPEVVSMKGRVNMREKSLSKVWNMNFLLFFYSFSSSIFSASPTTTLPKDRLTEEYAFNVLTVFPTVDQRKFWMYCPVAGIDDRSAASRSKLVSTVMWLTPWPLTFLNCS